MKNKVQIIFEALGSAEVQKELFKIGGAFGKLFNSVQNFASGLPLLIRAATELGSALLDITINASRWYEEIANYAERLGTTTEALSRYSYAAEQYGVTQEQLTGGWQKMTRRIAEAATGTGAAKDTLNELGLSATELTQLSPDKQFEAIAGALSKVTNQSDKVRLAFELWDDEGVGMLQMLRDGTDGLKEMTAEAEKYGLVISEGAAQNALEFDESLNRLIGSINGVKNAFAEDAFPGLTELFNLLANVIADNRDAIVDFGRTTLQIIPFMIKVVGNLPQVFYDVKMAVHSVLGFIIELGKAVLQIAKALTYAAQAALGPAAWIGPLAEQFNEARAAIDAGISTMDEWSAAQADAALKAEQAAQEAANWGIVADRLASQATAMFKETGEAAKKAGDKIVTATNEAEKAGDKLKGSGEKTNDASQFNSSNEQKAELAKTDEGSAECKAICQELLECIKKIKESIEGIPDPQIDASQAKDSLESIGDTAGHVASKITHISDRISNVSGMEALIQRLAWLKSRAGSYGGKEIPGFTDVRRQMFAAEAAELEKLMGINVNSEGSGMTINGGVNISVHTESGDPQEIQVEIANDIKSNRSPILPAIKERLAPA